MKRSPLQSLREVVATNGSETSDLIRNILTRMEEIDGDISKSLYADVPDTEDRPPNGDDYNLLWDAIIDEITATLNIKRC